MKSATMLEAIFHPLPKPHVVLQSASIPTPTPRYLLIKVAVASSNPKDWQHPTRRQCSLNSGDDLAGTIAAVGPDVPSSFKIGDRVAAFHPMMSPSGAYAEYALAPATTTCHIPDSMSFEEASTIPLVSTTAALTLLRRQGLSSPWSKTGQAKKSTPLIIYGASSSLGTFAVKLARLSSIHPIIAIAGSNAVNVSKLLDATKGDTLLDYRVGKAQLISQVKSHLDSLGSPKAHHAFDCISEHESWIPLSQMLDLSPPSGVKSIVSVVSGAEKYESPEIPMGVEIVYTFVGSGHSGAYLPQMPKQPRKEDAEGDPKFVDAFFRWLEGALERQEYEGHPYEVVPGGLHGVEEGLRRLRMGQAGGKKMVYRIEETGGLFAA